MKKKNVVIVTGANGEIGRATCHALSESGYTVVAVTRTPRDLSFWGDNPHKNITNVVMSDLSDQTKVQSILHSFNHSDVDSINLVYCAAVFERITDFREVTEENWDNALQVNLKDAYLWNKEIADYAMNFDLEGSIVNITSQAWMTGGYGEVIPYASSKGGLVTMSKALARIVAPRGIRVNCVAPGFIETKSMRGNLDEAAMESFINRVPMGRLGQVEEVSDAIEFLVSSRSRYITGVTLAVTGGQLMH